MRGSLRRRLTALLLSVFLSLAAVSPAWAAEKPIRLYVDGQELKTDVPPQIIDGRTMVPVRVVADHLGFAVEWIAATETVRLTGPRTVELRLGQKEALLGGAWVPLDVPAQSVQGRTLVPLRFLAQATGYEVEWDPQEPAVRLHAPKVRIRDLYLAPGVRGRVEIRVSLDARDRTVVEGEIDPGLGWKTVGLDVNPGDGNSLRKAPVADGRFSVSVPLPGGSSYLVYLYSDDSIVPVGHFTVFVAESVQPQPLADEHGIRVVDLWMTEPTDRLSVTPLPGGMLRLEGTLGADVEEAWLSSPLLSTLNLPLANGDFEFVVPLKGPARHRLCIWAENKQRGCVVAEQTVENDLLPLTVWGHYLRFEEPLASGMTVGDSMRVAGQAQDLPFPVVRIDVKKLGAEDLVSQQSLPVRDGRFDGRIWFPFGAGEYEVTVWRPAVSDARSGGYMWWSAARWSVTSTVAEELRYLIPTRGVESDAPEIIALAEEITKGRSTPLEKARAIHDWVAQNIAYDVEKYRNGTFAPDDGALKTLATRKGVCQDYAYLTAALLRAAGIKARIASGQANGYGGWGGHAWTEAWVGDRWLIMDTTWDAGYIDGVRFYWRFQTKYFDPDPQVFAQDHRLEEYLD